MNDMKQMTHLFSKELKRKAMVAAAKQGVYSFSAVVREAVAFWLEHSGGQKPCPYCDWDMTPSEPVDVDDYNVVSYNCENCGASEEVRRYPPAGDEKEREPDED